MSHAHTRENTIPRGALTLVAALVGVALLATTAMRVTGATPAATPSVIRAQEQATATSARLLRFADRADGAVVITDATSGALVHLIPAGAETGFVRGVMRGLARDRRMRGIGEQPPFRLTLWSDGQLSLQDTATARDIELGAFGGANRAQFAQLLEARR